MEVNEKDEVVGEIEKMEAHKKGVLHRAFSIFIFNEDGKMLIHKRADEKYHGGGLWTNACCSHPTSDDLKGDAEKRLLEEMGFTCELNKIGVIQYKAEVGDLVENEIDHIFTGRYDGSINPDPKEVSEYLWISKAEIENDLQKNPDKYTPWFRIIYPRLKDLQEDEL